MKLKLSKKTGLVIATGAFIIILAGLFMAYSGQVGEQDELNEQLAQAQLNLDKIQMEQLSSRQAELETQLSDNLTALEAVKAILAQQQPAGSIAAATILFDVAEAHGLEVTEMTSSAPATESLEEVTFSVISLTAKVEGDVPSLVGFVAELNSYITTGIVKSTTITIPETSNETSNGTDNGTSNGTDNGTDNGTSNGTSNEEKASVDIHLVVYIYQEE